MKDPIPNELKTRITPKREVIIAVEEQQHEIKKTGDQNSGTKEDVTRLTYNSREIPRTYPRQVNLVNHHPKMIFIVEDNAMYAKSLEYFLKDRFRESEIRVFSQGELCIDNLHLNPDFIVMDYFLNSKEYLASNGLNIIRTIRKNNLNTRIILLSSQQNMDVTVEAVTDHHCSYVVKNETSFEKVYNLMRERKDFTKTE